MIFVETSAKTKDNVDKIFLESAKLVMEKIKNNSIDTSNDT